MLRIQPLVPLLTALALMTGLAVPAQAAGGDSENRREQKLVPRDDAAQGRALADRAKGQPVDKATKDKAKGKRSDWRDGYRAAVSLVQAGRYDEAIARFTSLDMGDRPDVLNYIGYANRKMGRMEAARAHYEGALALDPNHRGALEYYGEWHVEMGRIDDAKKFLERLAEECGPMCREHIDLADAITAKPSI